MSEHDKAARELWRLFAEEYVQDGLTRYRVPYSPEAEAWLIEQFARVERETRERTIEECAKVADGTLVQVHQSSGGDINYVSANPVAAAIRALSGGSK